MDVIDHKLISSFFVSEEYMYRSINFIFEATLGDFVTKNVKQMNETWDCRLISKSTLENIRIESHWIWKRKT